MNDALARVRGFFVEPCPPPSAPAAAAPVAVPVPPSVALVGAPEDAEMAGNALALALAAMWRAPCALVCAWAPPEATPRAPRMPAAPRARRMAGRLAERELTVAATGRVVRVALPAGPEEAVAAVARASSAAAVPTVVAVATPRPAALDQLLSVQDAVILATAPDTEASLALLARGALAALVPPLAVCEVRAGAGGRLLAAAGLRATPGVRRALAPALEALRR